MKETFLMQLKKAAARGGGDRYTCGEFDIYLPQRISRSDGAIPKEKVKVTVEDAE